MTFGFNDPRSITRACPSPQEPPCAHIMQTGVSHWSFKMQKQKYGHSPLSLSFLFYFSGSASSASALQRLLVQSQKLFRSGFVASNSLRETMYLIEWATYNLCILIIHGSTWIARSVIEHEWSRQKEHTCLPYKIHILQYRCHRRKDLTFRLAGVQGFSNAISKGIQVSTSAAQWVLPRVQRR